MVWNELTAEQQKAISLWMNQLFRPATGEWARLLAELEIIKVAYQATAQEALALLDATAEIPNTSGLAGAVSVTKEDLMALLIEFNSLLMAHNTEQDRELYVKLAGAVNVLR